MTMTDAERRLILERTALFDFAVAAIRWTTKPTERRRMRLVESARRAASHTGVPETFEDFADWLDQQTSDTATDETRSVGRRDTTGEGRASTRRAEDAGRSLKRRPEGRGAAVGGGEARPLGNTEKLLLPRSDDGEVLR